MRSAKYPIFILAAIGALGMMTSTARADVPMYLTKPGDIKVDGVLQDWDGTPFQQLSTTISGTQSAPTVRAALAYDNTHLYIAGNVVDPSFFRTDRYGDKEDHAELILSFPDQRGQYTRSFTVKLFAGKSGETEGKVRAVGLGSVQGAQIIEAPTRNGYTFEAKLPWTLFPPAAHTRVGLRGDIRYHDGNGSKVSSVIGTSSASRAAELPLLLIAPEQSLKAGLLREKGLHSPSFDLIADVAGDPMKERVLLYDRFMVVLGPRFRKGLEYYWADLGVDPKSGQLSLFETRDMTGDGKAEIVIRKRISIGNGWRELLQVLSFSADTPQPIFEHETGIGSSIGSIENSVKIIAAGKGHAIEVALGTDAGYDASNYAEPTDTDREPLLLPWGTVQSRRYVWNGKEFVKQSEQKKEPGSMPARPPGPPAPRAPTQDELLDQVFALYKKDHDIPANASPTFDFVTDVAGDPQLERIICHGKDLVVFGKGFREGRGYVSMNLSPFASASDIRHVSAHDITGDGHAEIIVRGIQRTKAPEELGDGELVREILLAYRVDESNITRVFGAETGVVLGNRRLQSLFAIVPTSQGFDIELRPGRAVGWTRSTWPYRQDSEAVSGLEPIVLPWTQEPFRFRFADGQFNR